VLVAATRPAAAHRQVSLRHLVEGPSRETNAFHRLINRGGRQLDNHRAFLCGRTVWPAAGWHGVCDRAFDVRTEDDELIARCVGRCTLALPLGSYELRFYDAQGQPERKSSFTVSGSAILEVEEGNSSVAILGAMAGIVGPILATVGSVLVKKPFVLPYAVSTDDTKGGLIGVRGAF